MSFDPLRATGVVLRGSAPDAPFLGTCFLFRQPTYVLTAAHVVAGAEASELTVVLPRTLPLETHRVSRAELCPGVDLAFLALADGPSSAEPFWNHVGNFGLGEDLMAYGFPEDVFGPTQGVATPRLFRGYYQRFYYHKSHLGYSYNAGEMNIAAPGGLSGGPIFRPGAPPMVMGLVTENLSSTTVLEAMEEQLAPTQTRQIQYQRVIQYGVSLLLDSHEEWLSQFIPPRPPWGRAA